MTSWLDLQLDPTLPGAELSTPDRARGKPFRVVEVSDDGLRVETSRGGAVRIRGRVFSTVLKVIRDRATEDDPWIRCSDDGLRQIARGENDGRECLSYVLPVLERAGAVEVDGGRPNRVRLAPEDEPDEDFTPWGGE